MDNDKKMEKVVSLCKRRGFVYQSSEIYGGLSGFWDYGPLGFLLKENIKKAWMDKFFLSRDDVFAIDCSIISHGRIWESAGHLKNFNDPMTECKKCKKRWRADQVKDSCPECQGELGEERVFNMMMKTDLGAIKDSSSEGFLRPETAQGIFVNFKNILNSFSPKLPFGIAQIGKAFRNEITPRDFLFRAREFEQMELEYFVEPTDWQKYFQYWKGEMLEFSEEIGIDMNKLVEVEISEKDRAHYSQKTIDLEFIFPFGQKELFGLAYRGDYDLKNHQKHSNQSMEMEDKNGNKFIPHVIEPTFGLDRAFLATLLSAYKEDEVNGDKREYLSLDPKMSPYKLAIFPLLKNKPELMEKAKQLFNSLKLDIKRVVFDDNGNIGKRYRRQDEIGTPFCITVDFEALEGKGVTIRDRDTAKQERIPEKEIINYINEKINK